MKTDRDGDARLFRSPAELEELELQAQDAPALAVPDEVLEVFGLRVEER
jgi:hypothetical protein